MPSTEPPMFKREVIQSQSRNNKHQLQRLLFPLFCILTVLPYTRNLFFTQQLNLSSVASNFSDVTHLWDVASLPATGVDQKWSIFILLFLFRYTRLLAHLIAFLYTKPVKPSSDPALAPDKATVIIPTVNPKGKHFEDNVESILANDPAELFIVTAGRGNQWRPTKRSLLHDTRLKVLHIETPNKRKQYCRAVREVRTPFTILVDDTIYWPSAYLSHLLAPFVNPLIGIAATSSIVQRTHTQLNLPTFFSLSSFTNFLACTYLTRRNFDTCGTWSIDGGVSTVSGRTSASRTCILQSPSFIHAFLNEYTFFGLVGPLNADDDKFITRWMVLQGWKIGIQTLPAELSPGTNMTPGLGEYLRKCLRWARTSWRSNLRVLVVEGQVWKRQVWCLYAVYVSGLVRVAVLYDAGMVWVLRKALTERKGQGGWWEMHGVSVLVGWILMTKMVKLVPHFRRYPADLVFFPAYMLFTYFYSAVKVWALLTCWNAAWGSRAGVDHSGKEAPSEEKQEYDSLSNGHQSGEYCRHDD